MKLATTRPSSAGDNMPVRSSGAVETIGAGQAIVAQGRPHARRPAQSRVLGAERKPEFVRAEVERDQEGQRRRLDRLQPSATAPGARALTQMPSSPAAAAHRPGSSARPGGASASPSPGAAIACGSSPLRSLAGGGAPGGGGSAAAAVSAAEAACSTKASR